MKVFNGDPQGPTPQQQSGLVRFHKEHSLHKKLQPRDRSGVIDRSLSCPQILFWAVARRPRIFALARDRDCPIALYIIGEPRQEDTLAPASSHVFATAESLSSFRPVIVKFAP